MLGYFMKKYTIFLAFQNSIKQMRNFKMKKILLFMGILLISISFVSATFYGGYKGASSSYAKTDSAPIYNLRYQGPSDEPSTSYYSGSWNNNNGASPSSGYTPVSQKLKTFNGPYTEVHKQNSDPSPRPVSTPTPSSNNFQAGGGYTPSSSFSVGYGYYSGYSGYYGDYGYGYGYGYDYGYDSYYSPTYYGSNYYGAYSYYPAYYW